MIHFLNILTFSQICGSIHGAVDKVQGPLLFRCILPGLLMTVGSADISPKGYGVIREHALHFIKHLMAHVSLIGNIYYSCK